MPDLYEELKDLTDVLEKILHEELPEAARTAASIEENLELKEVVTRLDEIQRTLGLRTYELLRNRPVEREHTGPVLQRIPGLGYSPEPPAGTPEPAPQEPVVMCEGLNCRETQHLEACFNCSKPFCSKHVDPALHPCGDTL